MDARTFLSPRRDLPAAPTEKWIWASAKIVFGAALVWGVSRYALGWNDVAAGWTAMLGLIFLLHFGLFDLLAQLWRSAGIPVRPLMRSPLASASLSDLWGRRWNLGFTALSNDYVFRPLFRTGGLAFATYVTFAVSGLIHDLVISLPAGAGFGLPTFYFLAQGAGVLLERSDLGRALHLDRGIPGRLFAWLVAAGPIFWLFHPPFVRAVILPMLRALGAL
jgi:alginate O-acetyltransferase complex protein AlgI